MVVVPPIRSSGRLLGAFHRHGLLYVCIVSQELPVDCDRYHLTYTSLNKVHAASHWVPSCDDSRNTSIFLVCCGLGIQEHSSAGRYFWVWFGETSNQSTFISSSYSFSLTDDSGKPKLLARWRWLIDLGVRRPRRACPPTFASLGIR